MPLGKIDCGMAQKLDLFQDYRNVCLAVAEMNEENGSENELFHKGAMFLFCLRMLFSMENLTI